MNHVKCRNCPFHVRSGDSVASDVAASHERASGHTVDVVPDSVVVYRRASELRAESNPRRRADA